MTTKKCTGCDYNDLNCDDSLCAMCDHVPELIIENVSTYDYSIAESVEAPRSFLVL